MIYTPPKNNLNSLPIREGFSLPEVNQDLVTMAINERKILEFFYNGYYRKVEPHACGRFSTGTKVLICWQTDGLSNSGKINCWKTFDLKKIKSLKVLDERFYRTRPNYNPNDRRLRPVYAKI